MSEPSARAAALAGFERAYGVRAHGVVRAPGRVNLLGEHIDYCGLTVLPMALERSVWVAFSLATGGRVRARVSDPTFPSADFATERPIPSGPPGDWGNYVRAAIEGIECDAGLDLFVATDLPIAAGLSSSSALVVGVGLAALVAAGREVPDRAELAARLAAAERYVGTAGGGMDQTASLLGRPGHAIAIDFAPLRVRPIALPVTWRIVVAHSGERAEKSGAAQAVYNARTREAAAAATLVSAACGARESSTSRFPPYGRLRARFATGELLRTAERVLDPTLLRRFRHIVGEADRVDDAIGRLEQGNLEDFGAALDASHRSLRDDYEVSTPALDDLVERLRGAGAAGARLTGAGLGGCAVALCDDRTVAAVLDAARAFQATRPDAPPAFVARAGGGAEVLSPGQE